MSKYLNLNQYQLSKLKTDYDKYNISKLEKRGGVLYVPYVVTGFWKKLLSVLFGRQADLIGENKLKSINLNTENNESTLNYQNFNQNNRRQNRKNGLSNLFSPRNRRGKKEREK